ncbi:MGH1-like glycoside hydrolase domain-containing protein [Streptomyces marinisediminis]|uniref:MGH1-like glycoside hydrolase domain-containing protein n=1 Tax=Streptomyces TaxID=1883 RepID=UPI003A4C5DBB
MDRVTDTDSAPATVPTTLLPTVPHQGGGAPAARRTRAALARRAARVLACNWTGGATVPARSLYPHQWSWDSAFIAVGLRHREPLRAHKELETLLGAQWADGRVPHIVFNPAVPRDAYFPSPDFWRSSTAGAAAGAPRHRETSGIVQPPVHALAVWLVHRAHPRTSRERSFLARLYPKLAAWHRYLADRRDLGGHGLAAVVHPWEPGMDNSPCWDAPLARVAPAAPDTFRRADLDHGAAADRPTDLDYGRYVRLAADYRDAGYDDARAAFAFAVEDPGFNALLVLSEHALADIAHELGADPQPHRTRARELTRAMERRLWDPASGQFRCRDLADGALIAERSAAGLLPLAVPDLPRPVVDALVATLEGPHFTADAASTGSDGSTASTGSAGGLGTGGGVGLVPSYDLRGRAFDRCRYWRGPAWFNVNWLLEGGLRRHGRTGRADALRAAMLRAADATEFAEYVDPLTGAGRGARDFGWTAALTLDLLAAPAPGAAAQPPEVSSSASAPTVAGA